MKTKHKIYKVTTEVLVSDTIYVVAESSEEAIEAGDSIFEMRFNDLTDTYETVTKCERIEKWELDSILEVIEECKNLNRGEE